MKASIIIKAIENRLAEHKDNLAKTIAQQEVEHNISLSFSKMELQVKIDELTEILEGIRLEALNHTEEE